MNKQKLEIKDPEKINNLCRQLAELIDIHINQGWFFSITEDTPVNAADINRIIEAFKINSYLHQNRINEAAELLRQLLNDTKKFIMPILREKLGISHLTSQKPDRFSNHFIKQSMIAYTFPHNLETLENLLNDLQDALERERNRPSFFKQVI